MQRDVRAAQRQEIKQILDENPTLVGLTLEYLRKGVMRATVDDESQLPDFLECTQKLGDIPPDFFREVVSSARGFFVESYVKHLQKHSKGVFLLQCVQFLCGISMKWELPAPMRAKQEDVHEGASRSGADVRALADQRELARRGGPQGRLWQGQGILGSRVL